MHESPADDFRLSEPPAETRRAFLSPLGGIASPRPVAVELDVYARVEALRVTRITRARVFLDGRAVAVEVPVGTEDMALVTLAEMLRQEGLHMEYAPLGA